MTKKERFISIKYKIILVLFIVVAFVASSISYSVYKRSNQIIHGSYSNEVGNNNDYLGFIERVEEFVRTDPDLKDDYPDKFFDFTKLFKEKLIQFGCK